MFYNNSNEDKIINSLWHRACDANSDRMMLQTLRRTLAVSADEIVITHVIEPLDLSIGDVITIGAGATRQTYHRWVWLPPSPHIHARRVGISTWQENM